MPGRCARLLLTAAVLGSLGPVTGCGGAPESGTQVQVDKEKEKELLKAMESFYTKGQGQPQKKAKGR